MVKFHTRDQWRWWLCRQQSSWLFTERINKTLEKHDVVTQFGHKDWRRAAVLIKFSLFETWEESRGGDYGEIVLHSYGALWHHMACRSKHMQWRVHLQWRSNTNSAKQTDDLNSKTKDDKLTRNHYMHFTQHQSRPASPVTATCANKRQQQVKVFHTHRLQRSLRFFQIYANNCRNHHINNYVIKFSDDRSFLT